MEPCEMTEDAFVESWLKSFEDDIRLNYKPYYFPQEFREIARAAHKNDDDIVRDVRAVWEPRLRSAHQHIMRNHNVLE